MQNKRKYGIIIKLLKRPHGQAVKTPPSHGGIRGSIPLEATKKNCAFAQLLRSVWHWRLFFINNKKLSKFAQFFILILSNASVNGFFFIFNHNWHYRAIFFDTSSGRNKFSDDNIFLESHKFVNFAFDCSIGKSS